MYPTFESYKSYTTTKIIIVFPLLYHASQCNATLQTTSSYTTTITQAVMYFHKKILSAYKTLYFSISSIIVCLPKRNGGFCESRRPFLCLQNMCYHQQRFLNKICLQLKKMYIFFNCIRQQTHCSARFCESWRHICRSLISTTPATTVCK